MIDEFPVVNRRAEHISLVIFIVAYLTSSLMNYLSSHLVKQDLDLQSFRDLRGVLSAFTAISVMSVLFQIAIAKNVPNESPRFSRDTKVTVGFVTIFVSLASYLLMMEDNSVAFKISILLGLNTFLSLLPIVKLSELLTEFRWFALATYSMVVASTRFLLWSLGNFIESLTDALASLALAQIVGLASIMFIGRSKQPKRVVPNGLPASSVQISLVVGFTALVASSSFARRSVMGDTASSYTEVSLLGRNIFLASLVVIYVIFPYLCANSSGKYVLGERFKATQMFVTGTASLVLVVVLFVNFVGLRPEDGAAISKTLNLSVLVAWYFMSLALVPIIYFIINNSRLGLLVLIPAAGMISGQVLSRNANQLATIFLLSSILFYAMALTPLLLRSRQVIRARVANLELPKVQTSSVSIVIPSYNAGSQVLVTASKIHKEFERHGIDHQIVVVSDGSTDESVVLLDSLNELWLEHVYLPENIGKGHALRIGFQRCSGSVTGFIDADGDIPPEQIIPMYFQLLHEGADVIFGSKWHPHSRVDIDHSRRQLSLLHRYVQRLLFRIDIRDTQVGIKLFKTESLRGILPVLREERFSLDLEIFVALVASGNSTFLESPVTIERKGPTTLTLGGIILVLVDMLRIFWRSRVLLQYELELNHASKSGEKRF